ncbi:hypothetical protein NECAME_01915 [Necator americanus]|uniref:Uncharacterized protein n=1 Tax=Necator americanus TaxID=51031 RepID=W2TKK6_NECAM|nr:hypothetical protein NECAME_01915 [Necator americanus]ETN82630.1 hypothetical protein NECAME_01915 [Necator americanus]
MAGTSNAALMSCGGSAWGCRRHYPLGWWPGKRLFTVIKKNTYKNNFVNFIDDKETIRLYWS